MFKIIILRLIRESRIMAVLLLSMCLVTAFLALGPLYIQALSISDFDQRIEQAADITFSVTIRNAAPFAENVPNLIEEYLGDYIGVQRSYATLSGFECGFLYEENAPDNIGISSYTYSCYRPYTYDNLDEHFTLSQGRFPQDTDSNIIEALLSLSAAEEGEYGIGDRFIMGSDPNQIVIFEVVGLVETILPTDAPFWFQQTMPRLTETYFTSTDVRGDLSFAIPENAFQNQVLEIVENETYIRQFEFLPETLEALDVNNFESQLRGLEDELTLLHPDISFTTSYKQLLADYKSGIEGAQGSIAILSFIVFALMIYNIVAISSLILEQQSQEWSMMASRGGSYFQLLYIQFLTVLVLGIIAAVVGAFLAYIIMIILASVGPYAAIIDVTRIGTIPPASFALSATAATIIVLVLTIPAWSLASKSLQSLKSSMARAPKSPIWARYYLDIIILGAGILFIGRLFALATDQPLADVLLNPGAWVELLSDAAFTELFSDAFNLAAPVLILLGASMLWLRIFPFVVDLLGSLVSNTRGLTLRLAFWNVARDPAHYAQLVLLLIATLALGTASVTLSQTHRIGGLSAARAEVGADASLSLDPRFYDESIDWNAFPDVINATPLMIYSTELNDTGAVIGMNLDDINSDFNPELTRPFRLLIDSTIDLPGLVLPENTVSLQMDIHPEAPQDEGVIDTQLSFTVEDSAGRTATIELTSDQSTNFGEFITYTSESISFGTAPYRITALNFLSQHNELPEFTHTVYLDNLRAINTLGDATVVNSFEPDTYDEWQWSSNSRLSQILFSTAGSNNEDIVSEGSHSLRIQYIMAINTVANTVRPLTLTYDASILPPIPVVVSQSFANAEGRASRFRRPLEIGDTLSIDLNLDTATASAARVEFSYLVVDIVANNYPTFVNNERLIFVDYDLLRYRLNTDNAVNQSNDSLYDYNVVLFDLGEQEASDAFIDTINDVDGYLGSEYAWIRYSEIQRDSLTNAVTGMLFVGFWVSLVLSLLDFGFYMTMTIRRRALSFATLRAIGWNENNLLKLLLIEQIIFIAPAMVIGVVFGILLATIILPFLDLIGSLQLQIPYTAILLLIIVLTLLFTLILGLTALTLRRLSLNKIMRFGE